MPPCADTLHARSGLAAFQRNLAALQPVLRAALRTREIALLSSRLAPADAAAPGADDAGFVEAAWRMGADLTLPWQPRIELTGARFGLHATCIADFLFAC